jgi:probable rRNA maturation factor
MCEMNIELSNLTASDCDDSRLISVAEFALTAMGIHRESELSISLVDEDEMSALHLRWMDEPGATDVLSFPMDEIKPHSSDQGPGMVGDVVLCPDYAARQAAEAGHGLQEELELLTVHGILHLLGYDHREDEEREMMFNLQGELLTKWRESK